MHDPRRRPEGWRAHGAPRSGLGVPCPQAQADGVPCLELMRCADCDWSRMTASGALPSAAAPETPWEPTHA